MKGCSRRQALGVELLELALHDLVDDLGRLLLVRHLLAVDLAFLVQHLARHRLPRHVGRIGGRHLHGQVLDELLEVRRARDEVRLAVHLEEHADLAPRVDVGRHHAVARLPMSLLGGVRQPLLPEVLDGALQVSLGGIQRRLAIHHAGPRALTKVLDQFSGRCHEFDSPGTRRRWSIARGGLGAISQLHLWPPPAYAAFCWWSGFRRQPTPPSPSRSRRAPRSGGLFRASASSLASVPTPSRIASAMREVMRRTARIASSLPGMG